MKKLITFLSLAVLIYACGGTDSEATDTTPPAAPKAPVAAAVDGKKVYNQYCVVCHGMDGKMGMSGAFDLTTSELPLEERELVIKNGRVNAEAGTAMTPFQSILKPEEIKAVAEYTLTLKVTN